MATSTETERHPRGVVPLALMAFAERVFTWDWYGPLIATYYLQLAKAGKLGTLVGHGVAKGVAEKVFGPLSDEMLTWKLNGLFNLAICAAMIVFGVVADRITGARKAAIAGGVLLTLGYLLMLERSLFYPASLLLILGNGLLRPNIAPQVSRLYPVGSPMRDRGFNIYYFGLNMGMFASPALIGTLAEEVGWHAAFVACAALTVACLGAFLAMTPTLAPEPTPVARPAPLVPDERRRMRAVVILSVVVGIGVIGVLTYQCNVLGVWFGATRPHVEVAGLTVPSRWLQQLPVNCVVLAFMLPIVSFIWRSQAKRGREPDAMTKIALGTVFLGASWLFLIAPGLAYEGGRSSSGLWIIGATFALTMGEIYFAPVGLSLVLRLSPARMASLSAAVWFVCRDLLCDYSGIAIGVARAKAGLSIQAYFPAQVVLCLVGALLIWRARGWVDRVSSSNV